jgi:ABC-type oligopeptide transport system substrate-binding subunit
VPFLLAGWRENGDPTSFLNDCLLTRDDATGKGVFNAGYSSPELDRLIDEASHAPSTSQRLQRYEKVAALAIGDMAVVPLFTRANVYGVSTRLAFEPRLDGKLLAVEMKPAD